MKNIGIHIYYKEQYKEIMIENGDTLQYSIFFEKNGQITSKNKTLPSADVWIEKIDGAWTITNNHTKQSKTVSYEEQYEINSKDKGIEALLWVRNPDELNQNFFKYWPSEETITIGRQNDHSIILSDPAIGQSSFEIGYEKNHYVLFPLNSAIYINGKKIKQPQKLKSNDEITLCGNKMVVQKDCLDVYDKVGNSTLQKQGQEYPLFQRPPRFYPTMPNETVEIPEPPAAPTKPSSSFFSIFLPTIIMIGVTVVISIFASSYGIYSLMFMLGSTIVSIINLIVQKSNYKKQKKLRKEKYLEQMDHYRKQFDKQKTIQSESMIQIHPDTDECIKRVETKDKNLWNRTPQDEDFLDMRVGIGSSPFGVTIETRQKQLTLEPDLLAEEPYRLADEYHTLSNVPVTVSLGKNVVAGLIGPRSYGIGTILSFLIQLATHHSYTEVKLIVLYPPNEADQWEGLKWLPHVWDDDFKVRFMAKDKRAAHQLLAQFNDILKERERKAKEYYDGILHMPHYVFVLADMTLLENEAIMSFLSKANPNMGYSSIFLSGRVETLPRDCKTIIEVDAKLGRFIKDPVHDENEVFTPDQVSSHTIEKFARIMSPIRLKQTTASTDIPKKITFLEMYQVKAVEELNIAKRWSKSETFSSLAVPLGVGMGGEILYFNLHEKAHGPHGLVAGTTGSGKSEILQSLVLSLAINFHPHDLAFVVIDYKGGGMADLFNNLPHLIGTITNLDGNRVMRALIAIESEMKRRQELFRQYGVNHIDAYQKMYKKGSCDQPLPHLIMLFDEFAELKVDQPEFMAQVISAARIGRTLGIHLILATQKPSGVVDEQIWSNSSFKLCLKVKTTQDSMEVLKTPEAADIKYPGRTYLQVGNNELFELFQSAWSGAEYRGNRDTDAKKISISKVDINGSRNLLYSNTLGEENDEEINELAALREYIIQSAQQLGIEKPNDLWTKPLEDVVYISEIDDQPIKDEVAAVIGMVDDPYQQTQYPLAFDFIQEGNLLVFADVGLGKTTMLQTLMVSLIENYTTQEVCFYILDYGSKILKSFEQVAHCGDVVTMDEEDKYRYFVKMINKEIEWRSEKFTKASVSNYYAYKQVSNEPIPIWIIALDNYSTFIELYPDEEEFIIRLCRDGASLGIYVVLTTSKISDVRYRVAMYFKNVIAIGVEDKFELSALVGKARSFDIPNQPGRGFIKGQPPLEIQIAFPFQGETEKEKINQMRAWIQTHSKQGEKHSAKKIPVMPKHLTLCQLYDTYKALEHQQDLYLPIGLNEDVEIATIDLQKNQYQLITGTYSSGKTNMLKAMLLTLVTRYTPEEVEVYIADNEYGDLYAYKDLPHVAMYCSSPENQINEMVEALEEEIKIRKQRIIEKRENKEVAQEGAREKDREKYIMIVIENIMEVIEHDDDQQTSFFENLLKERSLGIGLWLGGAAEEISSEYHSLIQTLKKLQQGIYFGDLFEQSLFNVRTRYSQKHTNQPGDGYRITKGQYSFIKTPYVSHDYLKKQIKEAHAIWSQ